MKPSSLKIIRTAMGLRQSDIARGIDVHPSTLSLIETGSARETPAILRARAKICAFLGVESERVFPKGKKG